MREGHESNRPTMPVFAGARWKRLGLHLKGHLFLFPSRPAPAYESRSGNRLLLIFIFMEGILGPRLSLFELLRLPVPPVWLRVPVLLGLALVLVRYFARLSPAQIGLHAWREWSLTEKSYFLQAFVIANIVFAVILANQLRMILADAGLWGPAAVTVGTNLLWGFHQELMYRGILQTELVRRWGSWRGILVSTVLFTFGPLHFYHFLRNGPWAAMPVLSGIFVTGLLLGILFRTSGNLFMVGALHGLGNAYMDGLHNLRR